MHTAADLVGQHQYQSGVKGFRLLTAQADVRVQQAFVEGVGVFKVEVILHGRWRAWCQAACPSAALMALATLPSNRLPVAAM